MRTTITIPDYLARQAIKISGAKKLSKAIAVSLSDYFRQRETLDLFDELFPGDKSAGDWSNLKKWRKGGTVTNN